MKKLLFFCFLIFFYFNAGAQSSFGWSRTYGGSGDDRLFSLVNNSDGTLTAVGYTYNSNDFDVNCQTHGGADAWMIRIDLFGNILWQKCFGGSLGDAFYQIKILPDGNYIVYGSTNSNDGDVSGNHGYPDNWLVKMDYDGNIIWQQCIGSPSNEYLDSMCIMPNGNILVTGMTSYGTGTFNNHHGTEGFNFDAFVVMVSPDGTIIKAKCFGGSGDDEFKNIDVVDGKIICSGVSYSNNGDVSQFTDDNDAWVIQLDDSLNIIKSGFWGQDGNAIIYAFIGKANNNYYFAGSTDKNYNNQNPANYSRRWLIISDTNFHVLKQFIYGGSNNDGASMAFFLNNNIIIANPTSSPDISVFGNYDYWFQIIDTLGTQLESNVCGTTKLNYATSGLVYYSNYFLVGYLDTADGCFNYYKGGAYDGLIMTLNNITGIKDVSNVVENAKVYPNPCFDKFIWQSQTEMNSAIEYYIYDLTGREVQHGNVKREREIIDVSALASATYILKTINPILKSIYSINKFSIIKN